MGEVANPRVMMSLFSSSVSNNIMEGRKALEEAGAKRKTPSELRAEQFKRMRVVPNEVLKSQMSGEKFNSGMVSESKKVELSKPPRYIDTRVPDIYPVTKPGDRIKSLSSKDKDSFLFQNQMKELSQNSTLSNAKLSSKLLLKRNGNEALSVYQNATTNGTYINENAVQNTISEKDNKFRNVAELSSSSQALSKGTAIDMEKALKGLANNKVSSGLISAHDASDSLDNVGSYLSGNSFSHEVNILGDKVPLDLSLKVSMRIVSSSSLNWCHKLNTTNELMGMKEFIVSYDTLQDNCHVINKHLSKSMQHVEASFWESLHSWVHPQSTLPPSLISMMTLSAARGGATEDDFLSKRLSSWEDSFRSIYYMFRKRMCNIFYFCTQQFIVMFMSGGFNQNTDNRCVAYLTRSTRGLRDLLKKHDVGFSMPLCGDEVEQATIEDLHELSEFERTNPGQTRVVDSMADIDNSSQSLLNFVGNSNVHGLYDFLLNHRSLLSSVGCVDVPVLYSPVPFQNASLHVPKVNCKQMKRLDAIPHTSLGDEALKDFSMKNGSSVETPNMSYAIEIKEEFIPPWVISKMCATIIADGKNFEASFVTAPLSDGLNIALDYYCSKGTSENLKPGKIHCNGSLKDSVLDPALRSSVIKHLKYANGSYLASLSYI